MQYFNPFGSVHLQVIHRMFKCHMTPMSLVDSIFSNSTLFLLIPHRSNFISFEKLYKWLYLNYSYFFLHKASHSHYSIFIISQKWLIFSTEKLADIGTDKVLSSAYKINLKILKKLGISSLKEKRKNDAPEMDPWGRPCVKKPKSESSPFILAC